MTLARQILPGRFYMVNRGCVQRQYLLRPDEMSNQAFMYCLGDAAEHCQIDLIVAQQMSNHYHLVLYDPWGRVVEFTERFNKHLAKCLNAARGRWDNLWSSEPPCLVELIDRAAVIEKIVYAAANPVLSDLVERVADWPGAPMVRAMLTQTPIEVRRPGHFFSKTNSTMPETVTLKFVIPAVLGDAQVVIDEVEKRLKGVEETHAECRAATGRHVLGRLAVLRQSWHESPTSREPRRGLRPRYATRSKWRRIETLSRNRDFAHDYRKARQALLANKPTTFPAGTYWLARFVGVPVLPPPPPPKQSPFAASKN